MGLAAGSQTVTLEKRYGEFEVVKNMSQATAVIRYTEETGYYDANGEWCDTKRKLRYISGDAVWFLFGLKGADLGITDGSVGMYLETALYGVMGGTIRLDADLTVNVTDENGNPVTTEYTVEKGTEVLATGTSGTALDLPVYLDASIRINVDGYDEILQVEPVLQGSVTRSFTLTPTV